MCPLFFTIFKRQMYFFLSSNEVQWKEIYLTVVFSSHCFTNIYSLLGYRATRLLETSWLEKITVCVIETMLVTLPLVQTNKAQSEVNRTNQVQTKINIVKGLQTSVIHLIPGSTCHSISNRMRYLLKNIFWSKHFPATTNCRSRHSRVFLV